METKEKMKAARNEKSVVSVKSKVDFLDTEGNKSYLPKLLPGSLNTLGLLALGSIILQGWIGWTKRNGG